MRPLAVLTLALAALAACDRAPQPMPEVLAAKAREMRRAADQPLNFLINREQAARWADRPLTGRGRYGTVLGRADLFLRAGRTAEAIALLTASDSATWSPQHTMLLGVAYLRQGEEANCLVAGHAAEVCILPFRGAAVHADPGPAQRAAALFARVLAADSTHGDARWLLNVASQALDGLPAGVPPTYLLPGLDGDGSVPRLRNVAPHRGVAAMGLSGGAALDDFDGDGDLDLLATSMALDDPIRYFENDGRGHFTERTHEAGLDGLTGGLNVVHGDLDNDGDLDVLVLRGAWIRSPWGDWPNSLLRNDGDGHFTDVTAEAGMGSEHPTQTAALADVDGDGDLDVFVGNEGRKTDPGRHASELFLNHGDGTFREAARPSGLVLDAFVKGAAWLDADGDGRPDLYVSVLNDPNRLFLNRSDGGTVWFEEAPNAAGAAGLTASFPVAVLDWDHDGRDDLIAFTYSERAYGPGTGIAAGAAAAALGQRPTGETTRLFQNTGRAFSDASEAAGLDRFASPTMGVNVEDFDGDGWFDLYAGTGAPSFAALVPNRLLMGGPGGRFTDRTYASGTGHLQKGHGVAFGDVDGDLDPDLYVVMGGAFDADTAANLLFENPWEDRGWVVLRLEGRRANRSAIGARVAVRVRDRDGATRTLRRTVGGGASFGSSSLQLEVGLGGGAVEAVEVVWPGSGTRDVFRDVEAGGRYRLVEGAATARPFTLPTAPTVATHR